MRALLVLMLIHASSMGIGGIQFPIMDVPELVQYWGYPFQQFWIETTDGYILNLHRIPSSVPNASVVFLQHGLFGSSSRYVTGPPNKSLGFILSDLGYDVWMGNTRGSTYSRNHTTLNPDVDLSQFWDFDWDTAAVGDLPASINFIKMETGKEKLFYISHSMGSTEFLVAASDENPSFHDSFLAAFLLAPAAFMTNHKGNTFYGDLAPYWKELEDAAEFLGIWELLPDLPFTSDIGHNQCDDLHLADNMELCLGLADLFFQTSRSQLNLTMLPIYFDVYPEGSSVKPVIHYAQLINCTEDCFRKYDFGSEQANNDAYGTPEPPDYDLSRITLPTFIFYGDGDTLAVAEDVVVLINTLPNVQLGYQVPVSGWMHNDFVYGINAPDYVYSIITEKMEEIINGPPPSP